MVEVVTMVAVIVVVMVGMAATGCIRRGSNRRMGARDTVR